jgi:hypothetical protein
MPNSRVVRAVVRGRPSALEPPLPSFLIIGAMKAGTTSLFHYLGAHPQVFMSPRKEVDFFVEEKNWGRGLDWYRRQFTGAGPTALAVGEASPSYSKYPAHAGVSERISSCLPGARLIYLLRDPIERIRSHYEHGVITRSERDPIDAAVVRDPSYVDCSRYALQIEQYLNWFPRDSLLLVTSEDLRSSRGSTMRRIYQFLQVDPDFLPASLGRDYYTTEEHAGYPGYAWWIRRLVKRHLPIGGRAKQFIDRVVPRSVGSLQPAAPPSRPAASISEDLRLRLQDLLRDDVKALRAYMPDGFDGWGIA